MPQADMHFNISFPTFDQNTDSVKSLINFFMQDALFYFHGVYDNGTLDHITGNLQSKHRTIVMGSYDDPVQYALNIAYSNTSPNPYPALVEGDLPDITEELLTKTSLLQFCYYFNDYDDNYEYKVKAFSSGVSPINLSVALTPKIGSTVNTDNTYSPSNISELSPTVEVPITVEGLTFQYDFHLRTSSFRIALSSGSNPDHYDVYYKIGICPFTNKVTTDFSSNSTAGMTLEQIKNALKTVYNGSSWTGGKRFFARLESVCEPAVFSVGIGRKANYDIVCEKEFVQERSLGSLIYDDIPVRMIFPLMLSSDIEGLLYIELFNNDGTPFTGSSQANISSLQISEDNETYVNATDGSGNNVMALTITDQNISSGFIPSYQATEE